MKALARWSCLLTVGVSLNSPCPAQVHPEVPYDNNPIQVFHLNNVAQGNDANEVMVTVRNLLDPRCKLILIPSTSDIAVSAPTDQIARAGQLIAELDRPKKVYRLTFTLNESDAGKRLGVQHFGLITVTGQHTVLKQGDKIPVVTGYFSTDKVAQQDQVTYLDIGMNLDINLDEFAHGLRLRSIVEQSSVAPEPSSSKLPNDPIVRQSKIEGTSVLTPGKPLVIGSLDIVGSTRHVDIEVIAEPLP